MQLWKAHQCEFFCLVYCMTSYLFKRVLELARREPVLKRQLLTYFVGRVETKSLKSRVNPVYGEEGVNQQQRDNTNTLIKKRRLGFDAYGTCVRAPSSITTRPIARTEMRCERRDLFWMMSIVWLVLLRTNDPILTRPLVILAISFLIALRLVFLPSHGASGWVDFGSILSLLERGFPRVLTRTIRIR